MREPRISINGTALTAAQSMALRVAATDFPVGLGPIPGAALGPIGDAYAIRLNEILALMLENGDQSFPNPSENGSKINT